ncbi:MAG: pitrilysin family protein [Anaerolineales bacterium]|nr:pitrilysin family protein [Anaerolineales bacterium]MDP3185166.1 pitrilysin family protein [Anaerolineales bacterium]
MPDPVQRTTLANGLQVLLKEIHTAPITSSWVWYRAGSRDEASGRTGISHWVEHMQFKGTPQFPASILDKAISREGGVWNAFTFMDWTTYFETMPGDKIDLALRLEADRMVNSAFDPEEVASERTVIISEREGSQNEPLFLLGEAVQAAAFRVHPYHHEIIGDLVDLKTISRDDLYQYYRSYYLPNNAVVALAGDFETETMLKRIRELFEPIPVGATPPRLDRPEPPQHGEHRLSIEGPGETTYIEVCYHAPSGCDPDFFPLTVLDSLLTGPSSLNMFGGGGVSNKTSRLYRALVEKELAVAIGGSAATTIDPFLYTVIITVHPRSSGVHPKRKAEEVLLAFDDEIKRVQDEIVPAAEVARAIKQARAMFAYGSENITNQAFWLGHAEMFATYDWFLDYLDKLATITPADVQRAAQKFLRPQNRVVGTYIPTGAEVGHE